MIEKLVQKELQKLDPDLFLDKTWHQGTLIYQVKHFIGSGIEPNIVLNWALPDGTPLPLSLNIIDRVKMQEGSIVEAIEQAKAHNKAKKEAVMVEAAVKADEIAREFQFERRNKKISVPVTRMRREQRF